MNTHVILYIIAAIVGTIGLSITAIELYNRVYKAEFYGNLFIMGCVFIIIGTVFSGIAHLKQLKFNEEASEQSQNRLIAELAEVASPEQEYERLRDEIQSRGQRNIAINDDEVQETKEENELSIEDRIRNAIRDIPEKLKEEDQRKWDALFNESQAQKRAESIELEFRPKIQDIINLVFEVIVKSSEEGLVTLSEIPTKMKLPPQIMYTAYIMEVDNIDDEDTSTRMVLQFGPEVYWSIYLKLGFVKSPDKLTKERWREGADIVYPMLRIQEFVRGENTTLATIAFHVDTKDLYIHHNNRNAASEKVKYTIDQLQQTLKGKEQVESVLIELLSYTRLKSRSR